MSAKKTDGKKVIIVGAGISGMTAGIYLQKAGYETEIYEKKSYHKDSWQG